jgi:hypothetical protein
MDKRHTAVDRYQTDERYGTPAEMADAKEVRDGKQDEKPAKSKKK